MRILNVLKMNGRAKRASRRGLRHGQSLDAVVSIFGLVTYVEGLFSQLAEVGWLQLCHNGKHKLLVDSVEGG